MIESAPQFERTEILSKGVQLYSILQSDDVLKSINNDYLYWDKVKYKKTSHSPEELWCAVKLSRLLISKEVKFGNYLFTYATTDYVQESLHFFDLNIGGSLGSNVGIVETDKSKYLISSIMEEAISSSQMEGAATTRKKAKDMLQKELKPKNKSEQMILNNYETIQYITQHRNDDLSLENLLYIHGLITKDTLEKPQDEGLFRNNDDIYVVNHVTSEVVHQPPHYGEIKDLLTALCNFFNKESGDFIHPIIKGIMIHFLIAWIHPFSDGNGRTARTLFYWYMLKKGYWLTEYLSISRIIKDTKNQYEKAYLYTENDENDLTYFVTYHLKTMEKAFDALKEYIRRKQSEVKRAAQYLKIPNVNERQAQIIKLLHEESDRVLSIREMENRFQVSNYTARTDLRGLEELGFLTVIQVNKKKQSFIKSTDFDTILKKIML
ncbi:MAG: Fic family protein [Bacteroidales bacterium]